MTTIDIEVIKRLFPLIYSKHKELLEELRTTGTELTTNCGQRLCIEDLLSSRVEIFYFLSSELMKVNGDETEECREAASVVFSNGRASQDLTKSLSVYALTRIKESLPVTNI